jgi:hypothetical protein
MIILHTLIVTCIEDGEPSIYRVGNTGLQSIQFIGNGTHRLTYNDGSVLFIKAENFVSEGTKEE